jgi:large subunit ribosomal protein L10
MAKPAKFATVSEIADKFRNSQAAVVTDSRPLPLAQPPTLRRSLGADTAYTIAKNTLVKRAAADAGVQGLDELFTGPTAIAFVSGEPVDAAKALRDFAKANPLLVIKGGLLDGNAATPADVTRLADLGSREVLLAKMAGAMKATLTKAAVMFNQLPSQVARLAAALQEKRAAGGETVPAEAATEAPASDSDTAPAESDAAPAADTPDQADQV